MKSSLLLLATIASLGFGEQTFEDARKGMSPRVRTFGYETTYPTATAEYEAADSKAYGRLSFDVGANYEAPVYTQAQYYIGRQRASFFVGGRQQASITLYPLRLNFYVDLWPAKLTYENYIDYDLLGEGGFCWAAYRFWDTLRFLLYLQIDYMDCALGIFGYFLDSTAPDNIDGLEVCQWQTYYVNRPILDWNPWN